MGQTPIPNPRYRRRSRTERRLGRLERRVYRTPAGIAQASWLLLAFLVFVVLLVVSR